MQALIQGKVPAVEGELLACVRVRVRVRVCVCVCVCVYHEQHRAANPLVTPFTVAGAEFGSSCSSMEEKVSLLM